MPEPPGAWPNGAVLWLRARSEWRRRWPALCALTVLVALSGAVVLAAVAGARRTRTSVDRTDRDARVPDAYATLSSTSLADGAIVTHLPEVAIGRRLALMGLFSTAGYAVAGSPIDSGFGQDILGSRLLRGRRPDPNDPLQIALAETTAKAFGLDVGDTFDLATPSAEQWSCLNAQSAATSPVCVAVNTTLDRSRIDLSQLGGVHVHLRVVGITRSLFEVGAQSHDIFFNFLTPAFFTKYRDAMPWSVTVMVRYRPGVSDAQFEAALRRALPNDAIDDFGTFTSVIDALRSTAGVLANGLLLFAAVAALVGLVLITQVVARHTEGGVEEQRLLRVFGVTRARLIVDAVAPLVPVALAGAVLAVCGAWIASYWMPIGIAHRAEFNPGFEFDVGTLLTGAIALVAIVLVAAAASSLWVHADAHDGRRARPKVAGHLMVGSITAMTAARMVSYVGRGRQAIPLRSAVAGTVLATTGILGVAVFSGSLTRLTSEPARQGWGWDAVVRGVPNDPAANRPSIVAARLAADPAVSAVTLAWTGYQPRVQGHSVDGFAEQFVEGHRGFVIVSGRAPDAPDEVALGAKTLRRAHVEIGGTVDVEDKRMQVVGTAIFPGTDDNFALADGVLLTRDGATALELDEPGTLPTAYAVSLKPGSDRTAALHRLRALNNGDPPAGPVAHAEIEQLRQLDRLPVLLAAFLVVVALLAVGHLIVQAVKRRAPRSRGAPYPRLHAAADETDRCVAGDDAHCHRRGRRGTGRPALGPVGLAACRRRLRDRARRRMALDGDRARARRDATARDGDCVVAGPTGRERTDRGDSPDGVATQAG